MCSHMIVVLSIVTLNVHGLCSKLFFPEFWELLTEHGIIILQETMTDTFDTDLISHEFYKKAYIVLL